MPEDDDMVLPDPQPASQASTQPFTQEAPAEHHGLRSPADRVTDDSFHSALENIRQRGTTAEPMDVDDTPKNKVEVQIPAKELKEKEPEREPDIEQKPAPEPVESSPPQKRVQLAIPEPENEEEEQKQEQAPSQSSPAKAPTAHPQHQEAKEDVNQNAPLDTMDDIGSPSDESSPDRPPIRKSSLNFASLPAREPLTKRTSRTSHIDLGKQNTGGSGYVGRQTGGHRTTQVAFDENTERDDKMDIDEREAPHEDMGGENRASKLHSKSSTQRLHEKISMLGKMQPSRPSKSIPSAPGLTSNQVAYPELPGSKLDEKADTSSQKASDTPAPDHMEVDNDDWIKPLGSTQKPALRKSRTLDIMEQPDQVDNGPPNGRGRDLQDNQRAKNDASVGSVARPQSAASMFSPRHAGHQKSASVSHFAPGESTTPVGSPSRQDGPLSASKSRLQSIMRSAKGLFSSSGGATAGGKLGSLSPETPRTAARNRANTHTAGASQMPRPTQISSPVKQEGRRTRSSTEREERRKQQELEDRQREEELKAQEQEKQKAAQLKATKEKASVEPETRAAPSSPKRLPRPQRQESKEPELAHDPKHAAPAQSKAGRPVKPTRQPAQQPKPQPVSIRVGSALSRQMPLASNSLSSSVQESNPPAPPSTSKQPSIKKKASNSSLHTAPSTSSFKSSVSSQSQRKAQLASERKKEQEEREARRKEEQKRELERKRAAQQQQQQQEEARRQEARSRSEAERKERERERAAIEDSKKAAHMQAIEKRRLENARRLERQGSQQPPNEVVSNIAFQVKSTTNCTVNQPDKQAPQPTRGEGPSRPASRLNSIQQLGRPISQPQPNPAKPPKRGLEDEATHRPAPRKPSATIQPTSDGKRRRTEDAENPMPVRPTMAPPIRQSNIRKVSLPLPYLTLMILTQDPTKPSVFGGQSSAAGPSGSSIFKAAQPQRPAHPMDMAKYTTGKIPFAEPNAPSKTPAGNPSKAPAPPRPSPKYPNGDNIALPEIATDSEDEDSDAEMLPVPKWAQPKELESLLRQQEGMEVDSIFGPIAPFSLEETFKADKKIKKFRERTSSANWGGPDGLTQDEIRKDLSERQKMKLNGGWSFTG